MKMNRMLTIILGLALLCANATAEDKKDAGFWDGLKGKVEKLVPKKKTAETTAVGGVRGAKDSSSEVLYWKGEEKIVEIADDEVTAFRAALDAAAAGKRNDASTKFDTFVQVYPKSVLRVDALQAIEELKAEK
jgi:TolA-binding protein